MKTLKICRGLDGFGKLVLSGLYGLYYTDWQHLAALSLSEVLLDFTVLVGVLKRM